MEKSRLLPNIRLRKVILDDFRNITHAEIDIPDGRVQDYVNGSPSILGLYGQNGSGKTSLILAISALKDALSGASLNYAEFSSCIRSGCSESKLAFEFSAYDGKDNTYDLYYSFKLSTDDRIEEVQKDRRVANEVFDFMGIGKVFNNEGDEKLSDYFIGPKDKKMVIFDEVVQFAATGNGKKFNKQVLVDTSEEACKASGKMFGNKAKYEQLTANSEAGIDDALYKAKVESAVNSTSFVFSDKANDLLVKGSDKMHYKLVLKGLKTFGENYLFVIMMTVTAANSMNMLPFSMWFDGGADGAFGYIHPLQLFEHCNVNEYLFPALKAAMERVSKVISTIVPNLSIELSEIGNTLSDSGEKMVMFDLVSVRNDVRIPLKYESDGIKRIISILSLLIAAYNHPSVTVVIDEIDSGIFEYMLGELLSIMNENAKGQFIFSSHNLRPLEVIPRKNLLFTTVNPENRFAKLDGISGNNNLRDSYFRTISLGTGKDAFYDSTDSFNIEQALFEAGQPMEN